MPTRKLPDPVYKFDADDSTNLALQGHQFIDFYHIPSGQSVYFKAFITQFEDAFQSEWSSDTGFGRMDPLQSFVRTGRTISLGFDVVAGSIGAAYSNMQDVEILLQMLYPTYEAGAGGATTIKNAPYFKVAFMNLIGDSKTFSPMGGVSRAKTSGLFATLNGFTMVPDLDAGFFQGYRKATRYDPSPSKSGGKIYPKVIRLATTMTILHESKTGWTPEGDWAGGRFPYRVKSKPSPEEIAFADATIIDGKYQVVPNELKTSRAQGILMSYEHEKYGKIEWTESQYADKGMGTDSYRGGEKEWAERKAKEKHLKRPRSRGLGTGMSALANKDIGWMLQVPAPPLPPVGTLGLENPTGRINGASAMLDAPYAILDAEGKPTGEYTSHLGLSRDEAALRAPPSEPHNPDAVVNRIRDQAEMRNNVVDELQGKINEEGVLDLTQDPRFTPEPQAPIDDAAMLDYELESLDQDEPQNADRVIRPALVPIKGKESKRPELVPIKATNLQALPEDASESQAPNLKQHEVAPGEKSAYAFPPGFYEGLDSDGDASESQAPNAALGHLEDSIRKSQDASIDAGVGTTEPKSTNLPIPESQLQDSAPEPASPQRKPEEHMGPPAPEPASGQSAETEMVWDMQLNKHVKKGTESQAGAAQYVPRPSTQPEQPAPEPSAPQSAETEMVWDMQLNKHVKKGTESQAGATQYAPPPSTQPDQPAPESHAPESGKVWDMKRNKFVPAGTQSHRVYDAETGETIPESASPNIKTHTHGHKHEHPEQTEPKPAKVSPMYSKGKPGEEGFAYVYPRGTEEKEQEYVTGFAAQRWQFQQKARKNKQEPQRPNIPGQRTGAIASLATEANVWDKDDAAHQLLHYHETTIYWNKHGQKLPNPKGAVRYTVRVTEHGGQSSSGDNKPKIWGGGGTKD